MFSFLLGDYDISTACTSIVARSNDGMIFHGRNLDYGIPGLQNITLQVEFVYGDELAYKGTKLFESKNDDWS